MMSNFPVVTWSFSGPQARETAKKHPHQLNQDIGEVFYSLNGACSFKCLKAKYIQETADLVRNRTFT